MIHFIYTSWRLVTDFLGFTSEALDHTYFIKKNGLRFRITGRFELNANKVNMLRIHKRMNFYLINRSERQKVLLVCSLSFNNGAYRTIEVEPKVEYLATIEVMEFI